MKRGDVFWVNLDPVVGSEVGKKRPAVVVHALDLGTGRPRRRAGGVRTLKWPRLSLWATTNRCLILVDSNGAMA